ncbi:hypothetical protein NMG60_11020138 [Bertholletia excelsa]
MESEPESSPKLSLLPLPSQPPEPPGMVTPPLQTPASVPFLWEEVPGKPRLGYSAGELPKPKSARRLDLPPRLVNEAKFINTPSPTTVLDGPYSGRSVAHTLSFSLGKTSFRSPDGAPARRQIGKERWNFSSWRWGTFKDNREDDGDSFDFSSPIGGVSQRELLSEEKRKRGRKGGRFFGSSKSHLWASIYQSIKQAVPWGRKEEKSRRLDSDV